MMIKKMLLEIIEGQCFLSLKKVWKELVVTMIDLSEFIKVKKFLWG